MPIKIPNNLPARDILTKEGVFVMREDRAAVQDIRPLRIALLNLMPEKIITETQFARLLGHTSLQIELTLLSTESYKGKNTAEEHMLSFYKHWSDVKNEKFDGLIITGAPVELMQFEDVAYWPELKEIFNWSLTNVFSTFTVCWGAQAALYHFYGIDKYTMPAKCFGLYNFKTNNHQAGIFRGFSDIYQMPISRHTDVKQEDIEANDKLIIMSASDEAGVGLVRDKEKRYTYMFNHLEYDANTLANEYHRDIKAGKDIELPADYFPNNNPNNRPLNTWRASAHLLFSNWIDEIYQFTPFDINKIPASTAKVD